MGRPPACERQLRHATSCWRKAGTAAPRGTPPTTAPAHHTPLTQVRGTGRTAGSIMRRGRAIFTIAIVCCCLPCNRLPGHFCARKAGHMEGLGWQQCPASQHSHWPHKPRSWHCGDDCACPCPCAPTAADRDRVAARGSTLTGTTPLPAREQGYWPAARKSSSALGCELPARRWGPTGKLFPNSGWHTPRRRACRLTTAGGSTSSCTERHQGWCDVL